MTDKASLTPSVQTTKGSFHGASFDFIATLKKLYEQFDKRYFDACRQHQERTSETLVSCQKTIWEAEKACWKTVASAESGPDRSSKLREAQEQLTTSVADANSSCQQSIGDGQRDLAREIGAIASDTKKSIEAAYGNLLKTVGEFWNSEASQDPTTLFDLCQFLSGVASEVSIAYSRLTAIMETIKQ